MKDVTTRYVVTGVRFVCQEGLRIDTLMKSNVKIQYIGLQRYHISNNTHNDTSEISV